MSFHLQARPLTQEEIWQQNGARLLEKECTKVHKGTTRGTAHHFEALDPEANVPEEV